ncbi:DUF1642 domain-containing protein [Streptococcus uberis]|uniref:DUF1642 domain-containing protein n=1 Tax=Streptococcus uberis TaxID=1349 RepID=UPI003D6BCA4F
MKIEGLKQGQAVWVKGFVDRSVFGERYGFIDFYNQDGNHCGHISRNNVREMKEEDIQLDQPKPIVPQFMLDWVNDSREYDYEFDEWFYYSNQPLEVYKWLNKKNKRQKELNALALVTLIVNGPDAVTVEKEKLYTVEIPNPNKEGFEKLVLGKRYNNKIAICLTPNENWEKLGAYKLTEQEIKKDFDWAWQWKKEVTE